MRGDSADIVIAGGGLSAAVAALALAKARPDLRLVLAADGETQRGTRIWPCFLTDVPPADRALVEPLFDGAWRKYEVRFPRFMRVVNTPCRMITADRIATVLAGALGEGCLVEEPVAWLDSAGVTLASGRRIHARAVIDARRGAGFPHLKGGWRVSYGRVLRFEHKHAFAHPLLMDFRVSQRDGLRFFSCVPISAHEAYICETQIGDDPHIDPAAQAERIEDYCRLANWRVAEVLSEHSEVLPLIGDGDCFAFWAVGQAGVARMGGWAGLLHPFSGSSLGPAVRAALALAQSPELPRGGADANSPIGQDLYITSREIASRHWRGAGYARLLARLLLCGFKPRRRYKLFERIYRLDQAVIERLYTGTLSLAERVKILLGKDMPVRCALEIMMGGCLGLASLDPDELSAAPASLVPPPEGLPHGL